MWEDNAFATFTYNNENLPPNGSLNHRHFQLMLKRLRKHFSVLQPNAIGLRPDQENQIRYFMSGEYGETTNRPHYHALLFNIKITDLLYWSKSPTGEKLYMSETINKIWGKGEVKIGAVTWNSAAYVARYIMKKAMGADAEINRKTDPTTGEILQQEYCQMSRRPGIGETWLKKYYTDVYPHGTVVINGKEIKPPLYYERRHKQKDPQGHKDLLQRRYENALANLEDNLNQRLDSKETVKLAQLKTLKRGKAQ